MALRPIPNDVASQVQPALWIFSGPWVGALGLAASVGFIAFRVLSTWYDVDLLPNLFVSSLPLLVVTAFVYLFVDGYPPSHPLDLFVWLLHRLHGWLYREGIIGIPPALWRPGPKPSPLADYQPEAEPR